MLVPLRPTVAAANVVLSNRTEVAPRAWLAGNPEPVMEIVFAVLAITAVVADNWIDETVVFRVVVAVLKNESVAEIVWTPVRKTGTWNVAIIDPAVNTGVAATDTPSMEKAPKLTPRLFANPEPTIVTVVPTAAEAGIMALMLGAPVFVNVAEPAIPVVVIV